MNKLEALIDIMSGAIRVYAVPCMFPEAHEEADRLSEGSEHVYQRQCVG